jgi:hypothetical protein
MNTTSYILSSIVIVLLPACRGQRLRQFPRLEGTKIFSQEKEGLKVCVGRFNAAESQAYFGTDLTYYGYVPLQLHILNTSNSVYTLKSNEVELSIVSPKKIMELLYHDTYKFFAWTTTPAVVFAWPLLSITLPTTWILSNDNAKITDNLLEKTLKRNETIEIKPHESCDKFIFAYEEDLPAQTTISFIKKRTESWLSFYVDLSQEPKSYKKR